MIPFEKKNISWDVLVIIFFNGIGDAILTLPLIRELIQFSKQRKVLLISPSDINEFIFFGLPCDHISVSFNRYKSYPFEKEKIDLANIINYISRYETPILISLNAYFPVWGIENKLKELIHFKAIWDFGEKPHHFQKRHGRIIPMIEQYYAVVGKDFTSAKLERSPYLKLENSIFSQPNHPYIAIHTDTECNKEWSNEEWLKLLKALKKRYLLPMVLLGSNKKLLDLSNEHDKELLIDVPFDWHLQVNILAQSKYFIGIDSCWAHNADAFGLSGLVLFGKNSNVEIWGPIGKLLNTLNTNLDNLKHTEVLNNIKL